MSNDQFHERYWQKAGGSPADHGFAVKERKAKLEMALASVPVGAPVLDAGCGNGEFSAFLEQLEYEDTGIDISSSAVLKAQRTIPAGRFEVASLETKLPFTDGAFDAVWCTEILEHLFDVHATLSELNRVLACQDLLIVITPYHGLTKNVVIAMVGFERHYDHYVSHLRFFTRKLLDVCLSRAGFATVRWIGIGRWWPLWMSHFVVAHKTSDPLSAPEILG